jgi:5-methylcytosine-specific restriction endonuclease McrA
MKKGIRSRYATNWQYISGYIRFERAKNRCEKCHLPADLIIRRRPHGHYSELTFSELEAVQQYMEFNKINEKTALKRLRLTKICLSVAHLDHNESNNDYSNLKCLCQRCHLLYDKHNNVMRSKAKPKASDFSGSFNFNS